MLETNKGKIQCKTWSFPAGEVGVRLIDPPEGVTQATITLSDNYSSDSIMKIIMLSQAVRDTYGVIPDLVIPYMPYGRQDKVHVVGEGNSRDAMIKMLTPFFCHITTEDGHSSFGKYDNVTDVEARINTEGYDFVVFPDEGARIKYKVTGVETAYGIKVRDKATGEILEYKLNRSIPEDATVLVVDDICDGGRTFIELAKLLPHKRDLQVTHGIFSRGIELIEALYCNVLYRNGVRAYV
jgi:ribose-phosphate pyrophosphokinase